MSYAPQFGQNTQAGVENYYERIQYGERSKNIKGESVWNNMETAHTREQRKKIEAVMEREKLTWEEKEKDLLNRIKFLVSLDV